MVEKTHHWQNSIPDPQTLLIWYGHSSCKQINKLKKALPKNCLYKVSMTVFPVHDDFKVSLAGVMYKISEAILITSGKTFFASNESFTIIHMFSCSFN